MGNVTSTTGAQFLVKALRSRLGSWVADNAHSITTLADHAVSNGLQTPAPVRTLAGAFVGVEAGPKPDEDTHLVVFEWALGYTRGDIKLVAEPSLESAVLSKLGESLAQLHSMPLPPTLNLVKPEAPGEHCLCDIGTFLECASDPSTLFAGHDTADAKWFRSWLPFLVQFWKDLPEPLCLIHGDAYLDNLLVQDGEGSPKLMLIDWEDSCKSNPVVDLAACAVGTCFTLSLGEGTEDVKVSLIHERLAALLAGYESQRPLSATERALLRPSMQVCAWACAAFRYGRFLEGVTDLKTKKYGQLMEVADMLTEMGTKFEEMAFPKTVVLDAAPEGAMEMKVTAKKGTNFYVRAASNFLRGTEAKPAEDGKDALEAKAPVDNLRISGLGDAINAAIAAARQCESDGLCTITRVQTACPIMKDAGRVSSCAQILIDVKRK